MLESKEAFLDYRKAQEVKLKEMVSTQPLVGVLTVEVNITDLCNRRCSFCPRVNPTLYPNRNVFIDDETIQVIIDQLKRLQYSGKISFSGFGEPLLNKNFVEIISKFRSALGSDVVIETNTNGDKLDSRFLKALFEAGLNSIYWNLYDGPEQIEKALSLVDTSGVDSERVRLRPHWDGYSEGEHNLFLNNRGGTLLDCNPLDFIESDRFPLKRSCNYPFYKLFIDWDGSVLSCSNDWFRKSVIGNVLDKDLSEIWFSSKQNELRRQLLREDRSCELCNRCDVDGSLFGESSVDAVVNSKYWNVPSTDRSR